MAGRKRDQFKDYGIRMDPELAVPMTKVAIGLGKREGKVGPLALDGVARRAIRRAAEREGIKLSETRDSMASKLGAEALLEAAGETRKVWVKYPHDWTPGLDELVNRDRASMHLSQVWRLAIEDYCMDLLRRWAREEKAAEVAAGVEAEVAAAG